MNLGGLLNRRVALFAALVAAAVAAAAAFVLWPRTPQPGTARHEVFTEAFWVGTAALDAGITGLPEEMLTKALAIVPDEPAALANRGLAYIRNNNQLALAAKDLEQAARLAPQSIEVKELLALLRERQNKLAEAIALQRELVAADPKSPRRQYKLNLLLNSEATEEADTERLAILGKIVDLRPTSLLALTELLKLAAKLRKPAEVERALGGLEKLSASWRPEAREILQGLKAQAAEKPLPPEFTANTSRLTAQLQGEPGFSAGARELNPTGDSAGEPLFETIKVPNVRAEAATPNLTHKIRYMDLRYSDEVSRGSWNVLLTAWLGARTGHSLWAANADEVRRVGQEDVTFPFPSGPKKVAPTAAGVLFVDLDNDLHTDLVLAGAGGLKLWKRQKGGGWKDVTEATKLSKEILGGDYFGAWPADLDADGDLDLILAPRSGPAVVLRNNLDGTWTPLKPFASVTSPRAFAWADLDGSGAPSACFLDEGGKLHLFRNLRSGQFEPAKTPALGPWTALCAADPLATGRLGLALLDPQGKIHLATFNEEWKVRELAATPPPLVGKPGEVGLYVADMDNNGAFDLVARTAARTAILLGDGKGAFTELEAQVGNDGKPEPFPGLMPPLDFDGDGMLDLLGISAGGKPYFAPAEKDTLGYRSVQIRPLANPTGEGDSRINTFNIGGEVEVRTGRLALKQPLTQPVTHFGLGTNRRLHLARILWTNGTAQWEFDRPASGYTVAEQRLKGSCPFLFSWDGEKMVFVSDFIWSSPLGMYINGQDKSSALQTTDWVRIRGDQLKARNGVYDLRVNANLWETHYIDELGLVAVDHPAGTECYVDERFFLEPTAPRIYLTGRARPVARAWDHKGEDVTAIVRDLDGKYLDRAGRGKWQGMTNDHWVEVDLGDDAPTEGEVYLLCSGWIHPTDSSVNFALTQSSLPGPEPLRLEVPDGKGGWRVGRPALGFPAGKNKTIVLRLDGIEAPGKVSRRVRLRTSMEVYWDRIAWARGLDPSAATETRIPFRTAELRHRGILAMTQADSSSPELPHYDRLEHSGQKWRDLAGFHTRHGDVAELLRAVDDRYVIMNAGDEVLLTFPELPIPEGKERTYIWVSDGWVKDGDLNTKWGGTVLPLPFHGMKDYDTPPGRLADDPVFKKLSRDWETYHTRLVLPEAFQRGLRPVRGGGR
jgi:tetratricopeptide (TPR) repeat protein